MGRESERVAAINAAGADLGELGNKTGASEVSGIQMCSLMPLSAVMPTSVLLAVSLRACPSIQEVRGATRDEDANYDRDDVVEQGRSRKHADGRDHESDGEGEKLSLIHI